MNIYHDLALVTDIPTISFKHINCDYLQQSCTSRELIFPHHHGIHHQCYHRIMPVLFTQYPCGACVSPSALVRQGRGCFNS